MQTITFYSYKGGVGRTLVVANVARYLAQFGQKVIAMDLDLEAPGLHYKLLPIAPDQDATPTRGLVDYVHAFVDKGGLPDHIEDYLVQVPLGPGIAGQVHLMPAGAVPSPDYWHKLARLDWHELFYSDDAQGIPLFLEIKERIRAAYEPAFLLVDARTGITEIGGVATTVLPDQLVCLLLNNRENLEGARAVLRGIRTVPRPPGAATAVKVIPVLSRLPARRKPEHEQQVIAEVTAFLNAPATHLEDTLELPEPLLLHVDRDLEIRERLLIATPEEGRGSVLLGDYLLLFEQLIPRELILAKPQLDLLIAHAKDALTDEPDGAQLELENLARFTDHADVYSELLRLYKLRSIFGPRVLAAAERLWSLVRDPYDPMLWYAVKTGFHTVIPFSMGQSPSLAFLEAVWRANGSDDMEIAKELAAGFATAEYDSHAADILIELGEHADPDETTVAWCVELLAWSERWDSAQVVIERYADQFGKSGRLLEAWARLVLSRSDAEVPPALGRCLEEIAAEDPIIALNLAKRAGRKLAPTLAGDIELQILAVALSDEAPTKRMRDLRSWFDQAGRVDEFDAHLRSLLGNEADGLRAVLTSRSATYQKITER